MGGHRSVAGERESDAGIDHLAVGLQAVRPLRVEDPQPGIARIPEIAGLADGHHPEPGHPLELVGARTAAVLDPVTVVLEWLDK